MDYLAPILLGAFALLLILVFFWRRQLNRPRLTFTVLPPYDIPDMLVVGGVMVQNGGRSAASNVKISVEYDAAELARIRHLAVVTEEEYALRSGGEQFSYATLRLRELGPGHQVFIYVSGPRAATPSVRVTSGKE